MLLGFWYVSGGNDYVRIPPLLLTFDPSTSHIDVSVTLLNDSIFELTEKFSATLSFPGDPLPGVTLSPDSAQITIFDDDG